MDYKKLSRVADSFVRVKDNLTFKDFIKESDYDKLFSTIDGFLSKSDLKEDLEDIAGVEDVSTWTEYAKKYGKDAAIEAVQEYGDKDFMETILSKMADSFPDSEGDLYAVYQVGGSLGESSNKVRIKGKSAKVVKTDLSREEALSFSKRMNATLSKGEKSYYGIRYGICKMSEIKY